MNSREPENREQGPAKTFARALLLAGLSSALLCVSACGARLRAPAFPAARSSSNAGADPFAELKERESAPALAYLHDENSNYDRALAPLSRLKWSIFHAILARQAAPESEDLPIGGYIYRSVSQDGLRYPVIYRAERAAPDKFHEVLNPNALIAGSGGAELGGIRFSPDQGRIAIALDPASAGARRILVSPIGGGEGAAELAVADAGEFEWLDDQRLVVLRKEAGRPAFVEICPASGDACREIFGEPDRRFFLSLTRSKNGRYVFVDSADAASNEVRFIPLAGEAAISAPIVSRAAGIRYKVEAMESSFLVLTNDAAPTNRLLTVGMATRPAPSVLLPADASRLLEGFEAFSSFLVTYELRGGSRRAVIRTTDGKQIRVVEAPAGFQLYPALNPDFATDKLRYQIGGFCSRPALLTLDMRSGGGPGSPAESVETDCRTELLQAPRSDGGTVPITLHYRGSPGPRPLVLYVYGAYGAEDADRYRPEALSLLDHDVAFAVAQVRGGGFAGSSSHDEGRGARKTNSIQDLLDARRFLVKRHYAADSKVAGAARSAGAVTLAAAMIRHPADFRAIALDAPFLDVFGAMLDPEQALSPREYSEWGDPRRPADLAAIHDYSPYQNLSRQHYPALMVRASFDDPIVPYWEALRFAAKLRDLQGADLSLLVKIFPNGGHNLAVDAFEKAERDAEEIAWLLNELGAN